MSIAEPTIKELITIAGKAVRGGADKTADFITGSDYDALNGPNAIIWSRQGQRDTDLFNDVNFNTAEGAALTRMGEKRYGIKRILDTRGQGTVRLARDAAGIAETIWAGTRIYAPGPIAKFYRTKKDTAVLASATYVDLDIEAVELGTGSAIELGSKLAKLGDVLKDPSWFVASLSCADGTTFERADEYRERIRLARRASRVGQTAKIIEVCKEAGAGSVALFRSDYAGEAYDHGLNVAYVGDLGNVGTPDLVKACTLALAKARVLGDHLQVLPMARATLDVDATVYLYASPALFDLTRLERIHHSVVRQYLNGTSGSFTYSLDGIRGAIAKHTPEVVRVDLAAPLADSLVVEGSRKNFPATLNRYVPGTITLRYDSV